MLAYIHIDGSNSFSFISDKKKLIRRQALVMLVVCGSCMFVYRHMIVVVGQLRRPVAQRETDIQVNLLL